MMIWASTMPRGVNSQPSPPSGPLRDSSKSTAKPTTTGGSPIPVYRITVISPRIRIRDHRPSTAPVGPPISVLIASARPVTNKDSQMISRTPESPVPSMLTARASPLKISSTVRSS